MGREAKATITLEQIKSLQDGESIKIKLPKNVEILNLTFAFDRYCIEVNYRINGIFDRMWKRFDEFWKDFDKLWKELDRKDNHSTAKKL